MKMKSLLRISAIASFILLLSIPSEARELGRYSKLPSCVLSETLSSIENLEGSGWTVSGNPTLSKNVFGNMLDLDGTGDYARSLSVDSTAETSIVLWFQVDTWADWSVIFDYEEDGNNQIYIQLFPTRKIHFTIKTATASQINLNTDDEVTTGDIHCIVVTYKTNQTKLYLDGTQRGATDTVCTMHDTSDPYYLGAQQGVSAFFNGQLGNFIVFDRILSDDEILDIYNGTAFDYEKDQTFKSNCSEINPLDIGWRGNGYDGTGTGLDATNIIGGHDGGKAIAFNGTNEKVDFGDVGNIRTISIWVRPDTTTEEILLIDTGVDIMVSGGTVTYTGLTADATYVDGVATTTMVADKWQHVVCVIDALTDANNFELATDGTNYGDIDVSEITTYETDVTQLMTEDIYKE